MKTMLKLVAIVVASIVLFGCASSPMRNGLMRTASTQEISPPSAGRVKIVFMRAGHVSDAINCEMIEVSGGDMRFIGQLSRDDKIVYETTPGKKVFMAYGTAADFMLADLEAGKTYYSIVKPNWATGGFAPTPIRANSSTETDVHSKEFQAWMSNTKVVEPNEKAPTWFVENKAHYEEIYKDYWNRFEKKDSHEKALRTLMPLDGV